MKIVDVPMRIEDGKTYNLWSYLTIPVTKTGPYTAKELRKSLRGVKKKLPFLYTADGYMMGEIEEIQEGQS